MNQSEPGNKERNTSKQDKILEEKDFIQENRLLGNASVWIPIIIISAVIIAIVGTYNWYLGRIEKEKSERPFLEVTNRQFSGFLWQFPTYLRMNSSIKTGYLPGFETTGEGVKLSEVDEDVTAPPDLIFLYHTWDRLLASEYIPRPISPELFDEFLDHTQIWLPILWIAAPKSYAELIKSEKYKSMTDLQILSETELPLIVRQSFQGWKNYFKEGPEINALQPTFGEMQSFLARYPHYARNYWRNIDEIAGKNIAGENYLRDFLNADIKTHEFIPKEQLSSFLKVAYFNAQQLNLNQ